MSEPAWTRREVATPRTRQGDGTEPEWPGRGGPEGLPTVTREGLHATGERHVAAVRSGGPRCHCRARLLILAVSSVTWV
jgi:hypothetical protein